jgi:hypothetical protein
MPGWAARMLAQKVQEREDVRVSARVNGPQVTIYCERGEMPRHTLDGICKAVIADSKRRNLEFHIKTGSSGHIVTFKGIKPRRH